MKQLILNKTVNIKQNMLLLVYKIVLMSCTYNLISVFY